MLVDAGVYDSFGNTGITILTHLKFYRHLEEGGGLRAVRPLVLVILIRVFCTLPSMLLLQAINAWRGFENFASSLSPALAGWYATLYSGSFDDGQPGSFPHVGPLPLQEFMWPLYTPVLVFLACVLLISPATSTVHYVTFEVSHATAAGDGAKEASQLNTNEGEGYGTGPVERRERFCLC